MSSKKFAGSASKDSSEDTTPQMWVEKYRPKHLKEIFDQTQVISRLESLVMRPDEMPHLLFAGPPGTGKTTTALCLAFEIMGDSWKDYTLELNASNERGIDTVRERIKNFASYADRREGIPFRIVLLDESDAMCLEPDTKILVGSLDKIEEKSLAELERIHGDRSFELPSFSNRSMRAENDSGTIVRSGRAELYEITLEDGRKVRASENHPFFSIRGASVVTIRTRDIIPGSTAIADFKNRFLRCYGCSRIFYLHNPNTTYEIYFCSLECRNVFFASISTNTRPEQRIEIANLAIQGMKEKNPHVSETYRAKRSEITRRPYAESRKNDFTSLQVSNDREGDWLGKQLNDDHKIALTTRTRRFFQVHPETKLQISEGLKRSLAREDGPYKKLVKQSFINPSKIASIDYWRKQHFRSKIDLKMANLLSLWKVPYKREQVIFYNESNHPYSLIIDFLIREKIALFVHGCWGHVCPTCQVEARQEKQRRNMVKDERHYRELEKLGYKIIIVWEHELKFDSLIYERILPRIYEAVGIAGGELPKIEHSKVISIRKLGESAVLNVSVKDNKNFFLSNGILTHNTNDAQTALRRIMEESSRTTRFILTANYSSNIIEPIQSRCAIFRFARLPENAVIRYLEEICRKEGIRFEVEGLEKIYEATDGDMRHALNMLQAASTLGDVSLQSVERVTGLSGKSKVGDILELAFDGEFAEARNRTIELLQVSGMSEHDFIKFANEALMKSSKSNSIDAIQATAETDFRLLQGSNPDIQISAYLATLARIGREGGQELKGGTKARKKEVEN